ncbi:MAG TPA: SDR family oxidoreductase [Hyphomonadaceae bacterium]|jgi:NAD(P)-dependent dehydrogenase (short-subunit alcohol dehydrogenase family)|nr:SDR family oxidoreductase [Hyphomonadaceae bacterium]
MAGRVSAAFSLEGKSVVITGATGAMGGAAAKSLHAAGADLVLSGANADGLKALAAELKGGGRVATVTRRPETPADADAIIGEAKERFGRLDGMIVSSGMNKVAPITDMVLADWENVMDANVRGSWLMCQAAGRQMIAQKAGGSVVLVSSTRGKLGHPAGYSAYCPSKAAVDLLGKTLATEWGKHKIRVNVIAPTVFRSELTAWMYADDEKGRAVREAMFSRIPLGRFAEPEDFEGALVYLLSAASSFVTGHVLYLDGGYTAC